MNEVLLSEFVLGDMRVEYLRGGGKIGLVIVPADLSTRTYFTDDVESLVQIAFTGATACGGFSAGHTMRNGGSIDALSYRGQVKDESESATSIVTEFDAANGLSIRHVLTFHRGRRAFRVRTEIENAGSNAVSIDLLTSFSLAGISPLPRGKRGESLVVHRIRSVWSAEGRVVAESVEDLQLETSWSRHGVRTERFGQTGSMPVRKFFPFVAIEDVGNRVTWAVQIACPSSWQIELYRRTDSLCVSGGLADFEFGHWRKILDPRERFETPWAYLTVVHAGVDAASQRLLDLHQEAFQLLRTRAISPVFNEFCTTWGEPSHEKVLKMVEAVRGKGLEYFLIDAGWFADPVNGWETSHGDWIVNSELFPQGLEKTVEAIRSAGMKPGIWFEIETCGERSRAFKQTEHLLHRDGAPITSGFRRFWDMADPWVVETLTQRVLGILKRYGFRYLKVDYNDSAGIGCDGAESLGEALRQKISASQDFFRRIRESIPDLVIENCASGGHRLEPSMMGLSDIASFSDAHECLEIPLIAANLHRVILPAQSLVWAVLRKRDTPQRIVYSLAATFLGVPCLSGDVFDLDAAQWKIVEDGLAFYKSLVEVIEHGTSAFFGPRQKSFRHPKGWQAVLRTGTKPDRAFALVHSFFGKFPRTASVPLGNGWRAEEVFGARQNSVAILDGVLTIEMRCAYEAVAVRLVRDGLA